MMVNDRRAVLVSLILAGSLISCAQRDPTQAALPAESQVPRHTTAQSGQMKVTCSGDQLTISANGSSLATILSEVSKCSGAKIDGSEAAARTKFFETIGPAPIRDVLSDLLDASGINYVIQVSESNPRKVATVLLLARVEHGPASDSSDGPTYSAGRRGAVQQARQNLRETEEAADAGEPVSGAESSVAEPSSSQGADAGPALVEPPPTTTARVPAANVDSAPPSSQMNLQDKISEMQRMFEQRKQMVQEQNAHPR